MWGLSKCVSKNRLLISWRFMGGGFWIYLVGPAYSIWETYPDPLVNPPVNGRARKTAGLADEIGDTPLSDQSECRTG